MSWHQYYSTSSAASTYGRHVHSYDPYFDNYDDGDVKPAVVEHWRRDQPAYGFTGVVEEDVKPAKPPKQPRPPCGGGAGGRRVHDGDDGTVPSWPAAEQFRSTLRTQESLAGLRARYGVPEGFGLIPAGASQSACDLKTYLSESNLVAAKISRVPACSGMEASRVQPSPPAKKRKAAATASVAGGGGPSGVVLRSELQAKERALAQAKGKISKLEEELGKAKARELAEARQALAYERQLGTHVIKAESGKGAGAGKRRRGAQ